MTQRYEDFYLNDILLFNNTMSYLNLNEYFCYCLRFSIYNLPKKKESSKKVVRKFNFARN